MNSFPSWRRIRAIPSWLIRLEFLPAGFRQLLRRSRDKLADCVVAVVRRSLGTNDPDLVEEDLIELHLHSYCKQALVRLRRSHGRDSDDRPRRPKGRGRP